MQYHIAKNGEQTGPLEREEVYRRLVSGRVTGSDLAWHEGLPEWQPLLKLLPPAPPTEPRFTASPPQVSALAIGSLTCGLLGLVTLVPAIPALILGHLALAAISKAGGALTGRGLALGGIVLGYVVIILSAALLIFGVPDFMPLGDQARLELSKNRAW